MQLFEIYKHKKTNEIIQINSFATHMNSFENMKIIFSRIENDGTQIGSSPSFNGYGTKEEIEEQYELLIPQEKLDKYSWEEIFELIK